MTAVAFDRFEFDPDTLELSANGKRIDLAPKPGRLLKAMLAVAPGIVTREAAQSILWPDGMYADPEQGLNACVRQLRAALGDSASAPQFVETLSKRGYRLIVPVKRRNGSGSRSGLGTQSLASGFVLAAVVAAVWFWTTNDAAHESVDDLDTGTAESLAQAKALRARNRAGDLENALEFYERILEQHPGAAPALAGKAMALVKLGSRSGYSRDRAHEMALEFVAMADALDPLADAAAARAYVSLYRDLDAATALTAFNDAIARDSQHAESYVGMAAALSALGRTGDAIDAATKAAYIDPLSYSARSDRCWYLLFDHRREEASAACAWAIEIDGDHKFSHLGLALAAAGDQARMEVAFRHYLESQGLEYADGDIEGGEFTCQAAQRMASQPPGAGFSAYEIASFYGLCGDAPAAGTWLQRATDAQQTAILYFPYDPRFDAVRDEIADMTSQPGNL